MSAVLRLILSFISKLIKSWREHPKIPADFSEIAGATPGTREFALLNSTLGSAVGAVTLITVSLAGISVAAVLAASAEDNNPELVQAYVEQSEPFSNGSVSDIVIKLTVVGEDGTPEELIFTVQADELDEFLEWIDELLQSEGVELLDMGVFQSDQTMDGTPGISGDPPPTDQSGDSDDDPDLGSPQADKDEPEPEDVEEVEEVVVEEEEEVEPEEEEEILDEEEVEPEEVEPEEIEEVKDNVDEDSGSSGGKHEKPVEPDPDPDPVYPDPAVDSFVLGKAYGILAAINESNYWLYYNIEDNPSFYEEDFILKLKEGFNAGCAEGMQAYEADLMKLLEAISSVVEEYPPELLAAEFAKMEIDGEIPVELLIMLDNLKSYEIIDHDNDEPIDHSEIISDVSEFYSVVYRYQFDGYCSRITGWAANIKEIYVDVFLGANGLDDFILKMKDRLGETFYPDSAEDVKLEEIFGKICEDFYDSFSDTDNYKAYQLGLNRGIFYNEMPSTAEVNYNVVTSTLQAMYDELLLEYQTKYGYENGSALFYIYYNAGYEIGKPLVKNIRDIADHYGEYYTLKYFEEYPGSLIYLATNKEGLEIDETFDISLYPELDAIFSLIEEHLIPDVCDMPYFYWFYTDNYNGYVWWLTGLTGLPGLAGITDLGGRIDFWLYMAKGSAYSLLEENDEVDAYVAAVKKYFDDNNYWAIDYGEAVKLEEIFERVFTEFYEENKTISNYDLGLCVGILMYIGESNQDLMDFISPITDKYVQSEAFNSGYSDGRDIPENIALLSAMNDILNNIETYDFVYWDNYYGAGQSQQLFDDSITKGLPMSLVKVLNKLKYYNGMDGSYTVAEIIQDASDSYNSYLEGWFTNWLDGFVQEKRYMVLYQYGYLYDISPYANKDAYINFAKENPPIVNYPVMDSSLNFNFGFNTNSYVRIFEELCGDYYDIRMVELYGEPVAPFSLGAFFNIPADSSPNIDTEDETQQTEPSQDDNPELQPEETTQSETDETNQDGGDDSEIEDATPQNGQTEQQSNIQQEPAVLPDESSMDSQDNQEAA